MSRCLLLGDLLGWGDALHSNDTALDSLAVDRLLALPPGTHGTPVDRWLPPWRGAFPH